MKRKFFYLVLFIFCLSFFSMAKQSGKKSDCDSSCPLKQQHRAKQIQPATAAKKEFDLLPFRIFIFSI
jgi:hypothetical protein